MSASDASTPDTAPRLTPRQRHPRYREDWIEPFRAAARETFRPGMTILDVGGGRRPALERSMLPLDARYVGLDLAMTELRAAPHGTYDEMVESDVTRRVQALDGRFDLAVSWQVLEHVTSMADTLRNVRSYLRPGGRFVAQLSGGRAFFSLAGRLVPTGIAARAMRLTMGRDPRTVFPAPYDACTWSGLTELLADWPAARVVPRYGGAAYFERLPPLQAAYLVVEDSMVRGRHRDLATHYLVIADA